MNTEPDPAKVPGGFVLVVTLLFAAIIFLVLGYGRDVRDLQRRVATLEEKTSNWAER
jgi:hypothetical protein